LLHPHTRAHSGQAANIQSGGSFVDSDARVTIYGTRLSAPVQVLVPKSGYNPSDLYWEVASINMQTWEVSVINQIVANPNFK
jgi:hypothetical protein